MKRYLVITAAILTAHTIMFGCKVVYLNYQNMKAWDMVHEIFKNRYMAA